MLPIPTDNKAPFKAKAQIIHEEPIILQMPDTFDTSLDGADCACMVQQDTGILYNCNGFQALSHLAARNQEPDLNLVAEACAHSSSLVDIDSSNHRLIVDD